MGKIFEFPYRTVAEISHQALLRNLGALRSHCRREIIPVVDERFFRPAEVNILLGDSHKAKKKLGWQPEVSFAQMVQMMVDRDMEIVAEKGE